MTDLEGFERRLLHALTDLDVRRAVSLPADTVNRSRPPVARQRLVLVAVTTVLVVGTTALAAASGLFPTARRRCDGSSPAWAVTAMSTPTERSGSA
jgi:hypothetical protein